MKHNKNYKGVFITYPKKGGSLKLELGHRMKDDKKGVIDSVQLQFIIDEHPPFLIHICLKRMLGMKHNKNYKGMFINYHKEGGSLK